MRSGNDLFDVSFEKGRNGVYFLNGQNLNVYKELSLWYAHQILANILHRNYLCCLVSGLSKISSKSQQRLYRNQQYRRRKNSGLFSLDEYFEGAVISF